MVLDSLQYDGIITLKGLLFKTSKRYWGKDYGRHTDFFLVNVFRQGAFSFHLSCSVLGLYTFLTGVTMINGICP